MPTVDLLYISYFCVVVSIERISFLPNEVRVLRDETRSYTTACVLHNMSLSSRDTERHDHRIRRTQIVVREKGSLFTVLVTSRLVTN